MDAFVEEILRATLSEKGHRCYAAMEALKLELVGQNYNAGILGCSKSSIYRGLKELAGNPFPDSCLICISSFPGTILVGLSWFASILRNSFAMSSLFIQAEAGYALLAFLLFRSWVRLL